MAMGAGLHADRSISFESHCLTPRQTDNRTVCSLWTTI